MTISGTEGFLRNQSREMGWKATRVKLLYMGWSGILSEATLGPLSVKAKAMK